jgi:putative ABC transport system substrate-binding protein
MAGSVVAALALSARAAKTETGPVRRVGILAAGPFHPIQSLKDCLAEHGWLEGKNVRFEERWGKTDDTSYPRLAADLVSLPVDIIVTWGTPALLSAKRATSTIPIVMGSIGDPLEIGAVTNLAKPGGNITGFSAQNYELEAKRLELLRELVPRAARIAAFGNRGNPYSDATIASLSSIAASSNLGLLPIEVDATRGLDDALDKMRSTRADAVLMLSIPAFLPYRQKIIDFMAANRLPAIYPYTEFVKLGGLIAYATDFDALYCRAADYVDKILRGNAPGEMPVQQADRFTLVINLTTAKALGLSVPPILLARANEVIE